MKFLAVDDEQNVEMLFQKNYDKVIDSGAKAFFTKPVDFDSLIKEVSQLVDNNVKKNSIGLWFNIEF